jgi:hypothetical protein
MDAPIMSRGWSAVPLSACAVTSYFSRAGPAAATIPLEKTSRRERPTNQVY